MACESWLDEYKVGCTDNPEKRLQDLQVGNPKKIRILHLISTASMTALEHHVHIGLGLSIEGNEFFIFNSDIEAITTVQNIANRYTTSSSIEYMCCGTALPDYNAYRRHIRVMHSEPHCCNQPDCQYVTLFKNHLDSHRIRQHFKPAAEKLGLSSFDELFTDEKPFCAVYEIFERSTKWWARLRSSNHRILCKKMS